MGWAPSIAIARVYYERFSPTRGGFILDFDVARMRDQRTTKGGKILSRYFERLFDSISFQRFGRRKTLQSCLPELLPKYQQLSGLQF